METIEQSQLIYGLIVKIGNQDLFATTEIKTAIIRQHPGGAKQERKGEKEVTNDLKYRKNFAVRYSVVLVGNG
jgi:hypothetical protein